MTDKQYPPLPMYVCRVIDGAYGETTSMLDVSHDSPLFTADQMRAYVDADRAQRLVPVDAPCIELKNILADKVEAYRRHVEEYNGVKIFRATGQEV